MATRSRTIAFSPLPNFDSPASVLGKTDSRIPVAVPRQPLAERRTSGVSTMTFILSPPREDRLPPTQAEQNEAMEKERQR